MMNCRFDVSAFDLRRSMCRLSKMIKIDVSTFEDRWSLCRPSKTDDRCEIMLLHLLKNIDGIVVCELRRGFALQCFHL